MAPMCP